ncbi:MAG: hypothetical protein JO248_06050 [Acidimicrobiia bacterium]|nr:hypothetical protein [Acidimicrobiia bacterium]MBV8983986.1 hypothetical protein [Acidimicrobiia bacterium]
MRKFRIVGAAVSLAALLGAAAAAGGPASAATSGVGTTQANTTAVSIKLGSNGSLLGVQLASDNGSANIDPKQGTPSAASSALSPLTSTSSVSALNLSLPKVSVASTGAANNKSVPSIDLTTPLTSGTINPLSLSSVVDATQGAASGLNSTLNNLGVVGGLLTVPNATSSLGATAKSGDADGLRGLSIPSIQVLNLGAVLQGLGINPANLQLGQVQNVLNTLNVTVPNGSGANLTNLTGTQLSTLVDNIQTALGTGPTGLGGLLQTLPLTDPLVTPLLGSITPLIPGGIPASDTTVAQLVTTLQGELGGVLNGALAGIANAPLLQVNNLVVGVTTKATDTVANSVADVSASLGSIKVGNVSIPGVDLASLVTNAQNTITTVLTDAGLPTGLLTVKALDSTKSVASQGGYVNALANLTGVHVALAPLSSLTGGAATANSATDSMSQLFTLANAGSVPALSPAMATLNGLLASTGAALTQGATVDVLQVGASSTFQAASTPSNPAAATPQSGTLATTGGPTQLLGIVGLLLLATVAGLRWLRRPVTTN